MLAEVAEVLASGLALIDADERQRADMQAWGEWFDVDLQLGVATSKSNRADRVARPVIEACRDRGKYGLGRDLYLLLGLALQMEGTVVDKLAKKRDLVAIRRVVGDFPAAALPSRVDNLTAGGFTDWWLKVLRPPPRPAPDPATVADAMSRLRALTWTGAQSLDDLDEPWIAPLIARGTEIIAPLLAEIAEGTPHSATAAATILHAAVRMQRKDIPLSWVAIPLLDLLDEGADVVVRNRGLGPEQWLADEAKWRTDDAAVRVSPRGDLYAWVSSHAGEYGNRLEATLLERTRDKLARRVNPHEPWLLGDLPVFHKPLAEVTHRGLAEIVDHIADAPGHYDGWLDADRIAHPFKWAKFPYGKPRGWRALVERLSGPFDD